MKLIFWNCQGLGNPLTIQQLKTMCKTANPDMVILVETKNKLDKTLTLTKPLKFQKHFVIEPQGNSGGMALFWNLDIQVQIHHYDTYFVAMSLIDQFDVCFDLSFVFVGDFNDVLDQTDKIGGLPFDPNQHVIFQTFIFNMNMHSLSYLGSDYTWSNRRAHPYLIQERIDRVFASPDWLQRHIHAQVQHLDVIGSDHCALLFTTDTTIPQPKGMFHFDKHWLNHPQLHQIIEEAWKFNSTGSPIQLEQQLYEARKQEDEFWRQKSRQIWLQQGDQNTKYFHASTMQRRRKNTILGLNDSHGNWITQPHMIQQLILEHFKDQFTSTIQSTQTQVSNPVPNRVNFDMNLALCRPVSIQEISNATFSINPSKALGSDGFTSLFYQNFWYLIQNDIVLSIQNFFQGGHILTSLNHTIIALIPKIPKPLIVSDFRPISLCSVFYKIISKIITSRLQNIVPVLTSQNQNAFTKGRSISDNVLLAHELIHYLKTRPSGNTHFMALKLDISKAYDRLEWPYIHSSLTAWGFHPSLLTGS
ncbi:uncharacterized protein LOC130015136 [Mercurialis annua]|uniref:uncharacterized protein LOC126668745 n=1 Tax=Mercurialis annua TaxID=3986 RepID=UPI002160DDCD|nr:uncharacterized protein LOC126668745 [Mercurialis annua]XP_055960695.1 uncharacterized protein LOC130015136 [Mercurialis annua]